MKRRDLMKVMAGAGAMWMLAGEMAAGQSSGDETVYELRIYHLNEGKLPLILERFRSKETKIFARYGMHGVAYWTPTDEPLAGRTLVYMLRHASRAAATASWAKFRADPGVGGGEGGVGEGRRVCEQARVDVSEADGLFAEGVAGRGESGWVCCRWTGGAWCSFRA